jgi:hypothetical protein
MQKLFPSLFTVACVAYQTMKEGPAKDLLEVVGDLPEDETSMYYFCLSCVP